MSLLDGYDRIQSCIGSCDERNAHPLLEWCQSIPEEDSTVILAGVESRLQNVRTAAGLDAWVAERFRPVIGGNLGPCLSELGVASFLKDQSDSLEFVSQRGDKPP